MTFAPERDAVGELQGLYGPFGFPERLLQKLWLRGDFNASPAFTADGRTLEILHPGRWNQLGGPDFKAARLRIDGKMVEGDVEVHLRESDWRAHGHARDSAYDGVILHVVLFPAAESWTLGVAGQLIPLLALLPLLHRGLEEYAADEAVERLANRAGSRALDELGALDEASRLALLRCHAETRWNQKVRYAKLRVDRLGWDEACHQSALEVLGYRFNRAAMLRVAGAFPLCAWSNNNEIVAAAFAAEQGRWSFHGVRPANHPTRRLATYARWARARPDWPRRLAEEPWIDQNRPESSGGGAVRAVTSRIRKEWGFAKLREAVLQSVTGDGLAGTRGDTLICDALLPLAASRIGNGVLPTLWFHWYTGDLPPFIRQTLRQLAVTSPTQPSCHGLSQGLLGWWIDQENVAAIRAR